MNCSTFHAGGKDHEDEVGFSPQPRSCGVRLPSVGEVERDEQTAATYNQCSGGTQEKPTRAQW